MSESNCGKASGQFNKVGASEVSGLWLEKYLFLVFSGTAIKCLFVRLGNGQHIQQFINFKAVTAAWDRFINKFSKAGVTQATL